MGSFDDLPIDIVWLILRHVLTVSYGDRLRHYWERSDYFSVYDDGLVAIRGLQMCHHLLSLSAVNKRIRLLLQSKCWWSPFSYRYGFIKGSIS